MKLLFVLLLVTFIVTKSFAAFSFDTPAMGNQFKSTVTSFCDPISNVIQLATPRDINRYKVVVEIIKRVTNRLNEFFQKYLQESLIGEPIIKSFTEVDAKFNATLKFYGNNRDRVFFGPQIKIFCAKMDFCLTTVSQSISDGKMLDVACVKSQIADFTTPLSATQSKLIPMIRARADMFAKLYYAQYREMGNLVKNFQNELRAKCKSDKACMVKYVRTYIFIRIFISSLLPTDQQHATHTQTHHRLATNFSH